MKKTITTSLIILFAPVITNAQIVISVGSSNPRSVNDLVDFFLRVLVTLIPILIGLAVLLFIWGLFRYFYSDGENTKKQAVRIITYGLVSIFVMVSIWGIIYFIASILGVNISGWGGPFLGDNQIPTSLPINTQIFR